MDVLKFRFDSTRTLEEYVESRTAADAPPLLSASDPEEYRKLLRNVIVCPPKNDTFKPETAFHLGASQRQVIEQVLQVCPLLIFYSQKNFHRSKKEMILSQAVSIGLFVCIHRVSRGPLSFSGSSA